MKAKLFCVADVLWFVGSPLPGRKFDHLEWTTSIFMVSFKLYVSTELVDEIVAALD